MIKEKQINKKKQLLDLMTSDEYNCILSFLEDVYLSEYDLKIFTVRASNLFLAFKDLLLEENGGRAKVLYRGKYTTPEKEPIIIVDKVLDYHTNFIARNQIRNILLVDDILIDGRTTATLYNSVAKKYPNIQIDIKVCVIKDDVLKKSEAVINNAHYELNGDLGICKHYSQIFADILMVMNQPNISFVPYIKIGTKNARSQGNAMCNELEELCHWMRDHNTVHELHFDSKEDKPLYESWFWVEDTIRKNQLVSTLRLNHNLTDDEYSIVPLVSLNPVSQKELASQLQELDRKGVFSANYAKELKKPIESYEVIDYCALFFTASFLWFYLFCKKANPNEINWETYIDHTKEVMEFGCELLDWNRVLKMDQEELEGIFEIIGTENGSNEFDSEIFTISNRTINQLYKSFKAIINKHEKDETDYQVKWSTIIHSFLRVECELNKKIPRVRKKKGELNGHDYFSEEIVGLPINLLVKNTEDTERKIVYWELLKAIDQRSGFIFPKKIVTSDSKIYLASLIFSGEQSYKSVGYDFTKTIEELDPQFSSFYEDSKKNFEDINRVLKENRPVFERLQETIKNLFGVLLKLVVVLWRIITRSFLLNVSISFLVIMLLLYILFKIAPHTAFITFSGKYDTVHLNTSAENIVIQKEEPPSKDLIYSNGITYAYNCHLVNNHSSFSHILIRMCGSYRFQSVTPELADSDITKDTDYRNPFGGDGILILANSSEETMEAFYYNLKDYFRNSIAGNNYNDHKSATENYIIDFLVHVIESTSIYRWIMQEIIAYKATNRDLTITYTPSDEYYNIEGNNILCFSPGFIVTPLNDQCYIDILAEDSYSAAPLYTIPITNDFLINCLLPTETENPSGLLFTGNCDVQKAPHDLLTVNGLLDIQAKVEGDFEFSYGYEPKEYELIGGRQIELDSRYAKLDLYIEPKYNKTSISLSGEVTGGYVSSVNLFPSFGSWYRENVYLVPLTLISTIFAAVTLIRSSNNSSSIMEIFQKEKKSTIPTVIIKLDTQSPITIATDENNTSAKVEIKEGRHTES